MKTPRLYVRDLSKWAKKPLGVPTAEPMASKPLPKSLKTPKNVSFVQVGLTLGMEKHYHYLQAFGFGQPTGIDLPGEAAGILVPQGRAKQIDLATMSMGQANAVTPLQLCNAVAAVANGGKLMKPYLVKKVVDQSGNVLQENQPTIVRQVISEETAYRLSMILEGEVINGTGKNAYIEGYRVGGKTGTARNSARGEISPQ